MSWPGEPGVPGPTGGRREDLILERRTDDGRLMTAHYLSGDRASVNVYDGGSGWVVGTMDADGRFELMRSTTAVESKDMPGMREFLEELRAIMPFASVLLT